ncbi:hypothetical protein [Escherichia coli]|uniref:hypothetical protein n=1 Tax=Escherichia coli TaxID=562 RepID=UPI002FCCE309
MARSPSPQHGGRRHAYVTFEVFEAGERLFPSAADNTQQEVLTGIDAVKAAIDDGDWFGALDGLGEMADSFLADMENLVANLPTYRQH